MESIKTIIQSLIPGKEYHISVNGQEAVKKAYEIIGNKCYTGLVIDSKRIAQIEVIIDEPGEYNGRPNKWVNFGYIASENIPAVITWLEKNGFSGCYATIQEEDDQTSDYIQEYNEIPFIIESDTNLNTETEEEKTMKSEQAITSSTKETIKGRKGNKMIITGNTNAKTILDNTGKNTFRFINYTLGIDFQKPVIMYYGEGSFTIKKVWSIIPHKEYDYNVCVILPARCGWLPGSYKYKIVKVFEYDFDISSFHDISVWFDNHNTIPDTYNTKGSFNDDRKTASHYYIIAQRKEYQTAVKTRDEHFTYTFNEYDRYIITEDTYKYASSNSLYFKDIQKQGKKRYYSTGSIYYHTSKSEDRPVNWFDKSGYFVRDRRNELKRKAKALRVEREKAKYLETNMAGYLDDIKTIVKTTKDYLIELLTKANSYRETTIVTSVLNYQFDSLVFDTELFEKRINEQWFASVNDCLKHYDRIREENNNIYAKIEEKTKAMEEKNNA